MRKLVKVEEGVTCASRERLRLPRVMLWAIALPMNKVIMDRFALACARLLVPKNGEHIITYLAINDVRKGGIWRGGA